MKIVMLDVSTLGEDISLGMFDKTGETVKYLMTKSEEVSERIFDADVIVVNKVKLTRENLDSAKNLKLICVTATGFDNIDTDYCREKDIAVCNVKSYSTQSVMQLTIAMAMSLIMHIREFDDYSKSGNYTKSGVQNHLKPVFYELTSLKWGVVGYGDIGKSVAKVVEALGAEVMIYNSSRGDIDEICEKADIISLHVPLNDGTRNLINRERIEKMKENAIVINMARGGVTDEEALADAIEKGSIGGIGVDVYSKEPFPEEHPYNRLKDYQNVLLTPHMAWGAYQSRVRCMEEVNENIKAFYKGEKRNRIC